MNRFLQQPEATFYHITTKTAWNKIKDEGFTVKSGKIFVSNIGEFPVLISIALEQLPEINDTLDEIVFLKFPQNKNNFQPNEIIKDNQAPIEWTKPFQNIILRNHIPKENIEFMMSLNLGKEFCRDILLGELGRISAVSAINYNSHDIKTIAEQLSY